MKPEYQDAVIAKCPQCKGTGEIVCGAGFGEDWIEKCPECEARLTELETAIIDEARNYSFTVRASHHWDGTGKAPDTRKARKALFDAIDEYESSIL